MDARQIRNEAFEEAARIADPPLKARAKPGAWYNRRAKIAADIRACLETESA